MALTLTDVRRIASDVAQQQYRAVDVAGVTSREGSSSSAEVIFVIGDYDSEPSRVVIGVSRQISEGECRSAVRTRLRARLVTRQGNPDSRDWPGDLQTLATRRTSHPS